MNSTRLPLIVLLGVSALAVAALAHRPQPAPIAAMVLPQDAGALPVPPIPATAAATGSQSPAQRLATLKREYRTHPGFRRLVALYNEDTGHPGRGETASLQALDAAAVAGGPVFALARAFQPQATMARAYEAYLNRHPTSSSGSP